MKKYEYKLLELDMGGGFMGKDQRKRAGEQLNEMGADGWEIVSVLTREGGITFGSGGGSKTPIFLLKREA